MPTLTFEQFADLVRAQPSADGGTVLVPVALRLLSDDLTPVVAYRRLVAPDERTAPSFLLESVEGGERAGRHSMLGARPSIEVVAYDRRVRVADHRAGQTQEFEDADPLTIPKRLSAGFRFVRPPERRGFALPRCALGGWFGFAAYDSVRYAEPEKLDRKRAPMDDRSLPDLHFAFYESVVIFDNVDKMAHVVHLASAPAGATDAQLASAWASAMARLEELAAALRGPSRLTPSGAVEPLGPPTTLGSNMTRAEHAAMVAKAQEYIRAGDIFQVVVGQRFERRSSADPFDVYRALRAVNPSPYMTYLQAEGCILVASSPEILCRVRRGERGAGVVTNRPLAGTRPRGGTPEEDARLEAELLADEKERAEHIMLVDLGRNDVGRVARPGSVQIPAMMQIERYSHVMHISSTVTGELREGLDCWDALRAALPAGTISGAPKIRAMQIIDKLEPVRRGPYGGGFGYVTPEGEMDIALALRTIVVPTARRERGAWLYHLQAAGGIVLDSRAEPEFMETVNKAAALARAIDLAEATFPRPAGT